MLIIHQFFWAHYKAKIYTELQKVVDKHPEDELLVLQTALNEFTRAKSSWAVKATLMIKSL